jgi:hypothetical protein
MKFTEYLKRQLTDFVDVYKRYFKTTYGAALILTIFMFIISAVLMKFSSFDRSVEGKLLSMISNFVTRYSFNGIYSIVDLTKSVFLYFISLFSLAVSRIKLPLAEGEDRDSFVLRLIHGEDIIIMLIPLVLSSAFDVGVYYLEYLLRDTGDYSNWIYALCFDFRVYVPILFFSLFIYRIRSGKMLKLNFKKIVFMLTSYWIFNEFAYEFITLIRHVVMRLFIAIFKVDFYFILETVMFIPVMAFLFLGYHSAMSTSAELLSEVKE